MYELLFLCLMLAGFWVLNAAATLAAVACWHGLRPCAQRWPARHQAQYLLLLRILPPAAAALFIACLVVPAYLTYEPRETGEVVGWKLGLLALISAGAIALAIGRGLRTLQATHRMTRAWLDRARGIEINGMTVPCFRIQHEFPLIAVIGLFRPRLFLAEQVLDTLTPDELEAAVAHECGHLAARDNLKRTLLRACRDLLSIIPGGVLDREWAAAAECSADEYAAKKTGSAGLELASALVKIARMTPAGLRPTTLAAVHFSGCGSAGILATRVQRLTEPDAHHLFRQGAGRDLEPAVFVGSMGLLLSVAVWCACNTPVLQLVHRALENVVVFLS